jgi:hypothetical protein
MRSIKSFSNQRHDQVIAAADAGVIGTIFAMFTNEAMQHLLEGLGHFILFPIAGILAVYRAILAVRQAHLDKFKNGTVVKAIVDVVSTVAILTAVIGGLALATTFALASPIIFTAVLGAKSLFHLGAAIYYFGKSKVSGVDNERKSRYRASMEGHLKGAFVLALSTIAVGLVMLAAQPVYAWIGIIAAGIGIGFSIVNAFRAHRKVKQTSETIAPTQALPAEVIYANILTASPEVKPIVTPMTISSATKYGRLFNRRPKNDTPFVAATATPPLLIL